MGKCECYESVWELQPVNVNPDFQGEGIGQALVADFKFQVKACGGFTIFLGTDDEDNMTTLANTDLYPTVFEHIARINNIKGHPYEFYGEGRKHPGAFGLGYCKFPVNNPAFTQVLRFTRGAFQVEMAIPDPQPKAGEIEIDPGLKTYLALSNSEIISNLRHPVQADRHLKKLQRDHARTQSGRLRREKARQRVAHQHEKVSNQRREFQHKRYHKLFGQFAVICLEDLHVNGMLTSHETIIWTNISTMLAGASSCASWSTRGSGMAVTSNRSIAGIHHQ